VRNLIFSSILPSCSSVSHQVEEGRPFCSVGQPHSHTNNTSDAVILSLLTSGAALFQILLLRATARNSVTLHRAYLCGGLIKFGTRFAACFWRTQLDTQICWLTANIKDLRVPSCQLMCFAEFASFEIYTRALSGRF
jgi:hypothetical protein